MLMNLEHQVLVPSADFNKYYLMNRDLRRADFRRITAEGLYCAGADLREADFSYANMYWLDLYTADCTKAIFRLAKLQRANFKSACLQYADFSYAVITHDDMNFPSSFAHANLAGAIFKGATLTGTEYDSKTVFPKGFDPVRHGMCRVKHEDEFLSNPPCISAW